MLFKVSGISGKAKIEEDEDVVEAVAAESSRRALTDVLGAERRDRILSALYLVRQDAVNLVRQASIRISKALVHNPPRTGELYSYDHHHVDTDPPFKSRRFCQSSFARSSHYWPIQRRNSKKYALLFIQTDSVYYVCRQLRGLWESYAESLASGY